MLDSVIRPYITPSLDKIAEKIGSLGMQANILTIAALMAGLIGCFFVAIQSYFFGLVVILASRLLHGLGGALAARSGHSDFSVYLRSACKTVFYAAFIFFFVMTLPVHMLAGLFVLLSGTVLKTCVAGYKAVTARRGTSDAPPSFAAGLADDTLVILFMMLVCLFPSWFSAAGFLLGILFWVSAFSYVMQGWYLFGQNSVQDVIASQDDLSA